MANVSTPCKRGHDLAEWTIRPSGRGRVCLACKRERQRDGYYQQLADGRPSCAHPNCSKEARPHQSLCPMHSGRKTRGTDMDAPLPSHRRWTRNADGRCAWRSCDKGAKTQGRCRTHYAYEHFYGLTEALFESLWSFQRGRCALCETPLTKWQVDHDHDCCDRIKTCGECVRGLLCPGCNHLEGLMKARGFTGIELELY